MGLIYLCGLPGVGKTTIGKMLARSREWPFVDLDREIEEHTGRTISDIFQTEGEQGFRERERRALTKISSESNAVIALGAGALQSGDNLMRVLESGSLIYLQMKPKDIAARSIDWSDRPLMQGTKSTEQLTKKLNALLSLREENYLRAHHTIEITSSMMATDVASLIDAALTGK